MRARSLRFSGKMKRPGGDSKVLRLELRVAVLVLVAGGTRLLTHEPFDKLNAVNFPFGILHASGALFDAVDRRRVKFFN